MLLHIISCGSSVADPGFPVGGGVDPLEGAWTSDLGTFRQKCMQNERTGSRRRGRAPGTPPRSANAANRLRSDYLSSMKHPTYGQR